MAVVFYRNGKIKSPLLEKYMFRFFLVIATFMILFTLGACSKPPQYEVLLQNDALILYKHLNSDTAREQMKNRAVKHCAHLGKNAVYGKSFCDSDRCESSYLCK